MPGPGDWAVQASGSTSYWFYSGEGEGKITFDGDTFTIDGGANTIHISKSALSWMLLSS